MHHLRSGCRACDGRELECFLRLGPTPLANSFLRAPEDFAGEQSFPLDVYHCSECSLVQLLDVIDPAELFRDYIYVSGSSDTMMAHFDDYARAVTEEAGLCADDLVVEVASNDGSLLRSFAARGLRTLGVEPARNVARIAREGGVETVSEFFDFALARQIRSERGAAAAVVANNVLAHVDDPRDFLRGCAALIRDDGRVVVEVPYLRELLEGIEYDTIYHEHLCYFSVISLMRLYEAAGLRISKVERVAVHGGSLRVTARRAGAGSTHAESVLAMAAGERSAKLDDAAVYCDFATAVERSRQQLLELLRGLREQGARVAAYGAPAKGNTLLNYCGIGADLLEYVVDRSPHKVGLYAPGSHLEVRPVSVLLEDAPDYLLILAWNLAEEIMQQQGAFAAAGGRFILPLPNAHVVAP